MSLMQAFLRTIAPTPAEQAQAEFERQLEANLAARKTLRPERQQAARKGVETKRGRR